MTDETQAVDLGILVAFAYQEFVRELRSHHAEQGFDDLGRSDGYVFRALATGPRTVSDLAVRFGISKQGAGQIIDDMERRGYVQRRPDPADARAKLVYMSARGEAALATARAFHQAYERRLTRQCGAEAMGSLRAVLTAMASGGDSVDPQLRGLFL